MNMPDSIHRALVSNQARAYSQTPPATVLRKRKPIAVADRIRLHPRADDLFRAVTRYNETFYFEVEFVQSPWIFYLKWSPNSPIRQKCKIRLGDWRSDLETAAKIEVLK